MTRSWRTFTLVALLGSSVFVLSQSPAQAQYRRPFIPVVRPYYVPPVVPYIPPPRAFVAVPPPIVPYANSFTYTPLGLNLNQVAALNVLRIQTQLYNSLYNPYYYGYPYTLQGPINFNAPGLQYSTFYGPGITYTPYNSYNPYFAAFGFH